MHGKDMSEVARQRVWEEHLVKISAQAAKAGGLNETFTVNPYRMQGKTITEPKINKRPARFLDREKAALEAIAKQLGPKAEALGLIPEPTRLPPIAAAGSSARGGLGDSEKLPPLPSARKPDEEDAGHKSLRKLHEIHEVPTKKYKFPQTESQEFGWLSQPLLKGGHQIHGKKSCDETRFAVHAVRMNAKRM